MRKVRFSTLFERSYRHLVGNYWVCTRENIKEIRQIIATDLHMFCTLNILIFENLSQQERKFSIHPFRKRVWLQLIIAKQPRKKEENLYDYAIEKRQITLYHIQK